MLAYAQGSIIPRVLAQESEEIDLYYGEKKNAKHTGGAQVIQRTNAIFNLSAVSGGSSSVYISPSDGISTLMVALKLPSVASSGFDYKGYALPQSFGWNAVNFVQMRIGNSSLFQWSGKQLMLQSIRTAGSQLEADDLMRLAGPCNFYNVDGSSSAPGLTGSPFTGEGDKNLWAYLAIPMPWCGAQSKNAPLPLPTDLLSSPVQIIINLKSPREILAASGAPEMTALPATFNWEQAFLQVKQHQLIGDKRPAKPSGPYVLPVDFVQQENSVSISPDVAEVPLLGFRNGSITELDLYVLPQTASAMDPFCYELPEDVEVIYMGNVIHNFRGYSSQFWTTVFSDKPSRWTNPQLVLTPAPVALFSVRGRITNWVQVPFEALYTEMDAEDPISSSGIAIQNGVINLRAKAASASTLYYTCDIQSAIVFHSGTADYAF
jgi:hypothetical protein